MAYIYVTWTLQSTKETVSEGYDMVVGYVFINRTQYRHLDHTSFIIFEKLAIKVPIFAFHVDGREKLHAFP